LKRLSFCCCPNEFPERRAPQQTNREAPAYAGLLRIIAPRGRSGDHLVAALAEGHRGNRLLAAMPPNTLALLEPDLRKVSLEAGAVLLEPGELIENIYFPLTGLISLMVIGKDGNFIETSTVGREGGVGLHSGLGRRRSFTRAIAQIGGKFSTIRTARFEHIANDSAPIRDLISRYTEVLWAETQQTAACNAMHSTSSRLCRWLLQSADRIGSDEVRLTQEFLAQMVGARRTTVTLLAQRMLKGPDQVQTRPYRDPGSQRGRGVRVRMLRRYPRPKASACAWREPLNRCKQCIVRLELLGVIDASVLFQSARRRHG
jgi:CRP-like cAMP-binding protein